MNRIEPARYADGRAMHVAGVRRTHTFAEAARAIPDQWQALTRLIPLPGQIGATTYGVICSGDPEAETVEYLCGVEVENLAALAPGIGRVRIPAAHYAVFEHHGPIAGLGPLWDAIFGQWLPRSGHRSAHSPDFERYDERFDPAAGAGVVELWVPIERREPT